MTRSGGGQRVSSNAFTKRSPLRPASALSQIALAPILKGLSGDPIVKRGIQWFLSSQIEVEYATNFDQLALKHWDMDEKFGGDDVIVSGGFQKIVEPLSDGLDIRYGHVVEKVSFDGSGVKVATSQGVIGADRVVVTLPLGVLQQERVQFEPQLPEAKRSSIGRLEMGVIEQDRATILKTFLARRCSSTGLAQQFPQRT